MKKLIIGLVMALSAATFAPTANAQDVRIGVGTDRSSMTVRTERPAVRYEDRTTVRREPSRVRYYARANCRTVITTKWRDGNRVTVRKRICR